MSFIKSGVIAGPAADAADIRARVGSDPVGPALDKSIDRKTDPPFIPVAMFGEEPAYDYIAASRMGSYWNIMSSFVLASGVFRYDSPTADSAKNAVAATDSAVPGLESFTRSYA